MLLEKYSIGTGDRFGHQGIAQLSALVKAKEMNCNIVPVWNKSMREHLLIGSSPADVKKEADNAVETLGWTDSYYVDADHINLKTVDNFIDYSSFFTIDVADYIGLPPEKEHLDLFLKAASGFKGSLNIPGIKDSFEINSTVLTTIGNKYLFAIKEASKIYRHITAQKRGTDFITEVSFDETTSPQTPVELFFILLGLSLEKIPVQTIAPKFTGRFNKGVDYEGNVEKFVREFEDDVAVIAEAVKIFSLPESLKLSVHSGSDKFSLYGHINRIIKKHNAGLHLKTAGTTWLEELVGLAEADGAGLALAKEIYTNSYKRIDELCKPYATVIDIDRKRLPSPEEVKSWTSSDYTGALRHDQKNLRYNIHLRQLLHLGYKVAAEMGERYTDALKKYEQIITQNVMENIFSRHLDPVFIKDAIII